MFSVIKVHAGDFVGGFYTPPDYGKGFGTLRLYKEDINDLSVKINKDKIHAVEVATQESAVRLGGERCWRGTGSVILGPFGLLRELILNERGVEITFILVLTNGKRILATTDRKAYLEIAKVVFNEAF
ncbi:hypothetical protein LF296_03230 [Acinetobacter vivianii]|uniref:Uncharacterized protein n=1 Tax=Acinetobacter vivianii TaxID=1776742 RepID=A0AAJ6NKE5_9GAMM|nr:hypothetical protein [Acinetobacter vivianii]WDZ51822.1 hypothetical protein LF296_03230 [Acinetobacter vivianii]